MASLYYRARTISGDVIEGRIDATSVEEARSTLSSEGLAILDIGENPSGAVARLPRLPLPHFPRVRLATLANVTGQLALMLRTGTSLLDAFDALCEQTTDEKLYEVLSAIRNDVNTGRSLAHAIEAHPDVFDDFYVSAVRAGEASGTMPQVFARLEANMEKRLEIRSTLATAMIYPIIVSVLALCAIVFVMTFVLPRFVTIFEQSGVALPAPTRMMMATSQAMVHYWYVFLAAFLGLPAAFYVFVRQPLGARLLDRFLLWMPIVGPLTTMLQTSAMLRTLGTLLSSGVSLIEALDVARDACKNGLFRNLVTDVTRSVTQGEDLARAFGRSTLLDPAIKQMIATGERTGALATVMVAVADHLDNQAEKQLKKLSAIFEPVLIVAMGVVIGFIAVSVLLPLFRLTQTVRGG